MVVAQLRVSLSILILSTALASCGRSELLCDGSDEIDGVKNVLKNDPPTQLLSAASSDTIQEQRQKFIEEVNAERQLKQSQCDEIADKNWVNDFAANFPWFQPLPKSPSQAYIFCPDVFYDYRRANPNGDNGAQSGNDATAAMERCWKLSHPDGHADWAACSNSLKQLDDKDAQNAQTIAKITKDAYAAVIYTLNAIRMESKDTTTGAVVCDAQLHAEIPNFGAANEDIEYKVERTTDGNLYVSIQGAN